MRNLFEPAFFLFAAMLAVAVVGQLATANRTGRRKQGGRGPSSAPREWRKRLSDRNATPAAEPGTSARTPRDAAAQLRDVLACEFTAKRVLSPSEARVFEAAEAHLARLNAGWRVMTQVSVGEIVRAQWSGYSAVNSKRVDLLIMDRSYQPIAAIEYAGTGHHQGDAAARDAVKREALRRAGIGYIEIAAGDRMRDLAAALDRLARQKGVLATAAPTVGAA
jgi:hypothetical protein